jgi:hypothetical protein
LTDLRHSNRKLTGAFNPILSKEHIVHHALISILQENARVALKTLIHPILNAGLMVVVYALLNYAVNQLSPYQMILIKFPGRIFQKLNMLKLYDEINLKN